MTPRGVSIAFGIGIVIASGFWLTLVMTQPTLTYETPDGGTVTFRCESVYVPRSDIVDVPYVEPLEGEIDLRDELRYPLASDGGEDDAEDVLTISAAQMTADCASARVQRVRWVWAPAIAGVLGLGLLWRGGTSREPWPPPIDRTARKR